MRGTAPAITACALALALTACAPPQYETNWTQMHTGMTRDQVEELLGKPSSTFTPRAQQSDGESDASARSNAMERWQYGDTLSSLGTRALFPEEADERTWCVFFGPDGKVSGFEQPRYGR
jgi:hypothetical protein